MTHVMPVLAVMSLVAACSELPPVTELQCGNGILEPLEDCDNPTALCVQCSRVCADDGNCPYGSTCGRDDICHAPSGQFDPEPRASLPFQVVAFRIADIDHDGFGDVVGLNQTAMSVRYGDARGAIPDSYTVVTPQVQGQPALTHLVDPDIDDVILPTTDGLVAYTGAFGVPSPRQFPLGSAEGPENMGGRVDPYDAVGVDDTIALIGPTPGDTPVLSFGVMAMTQVGPVFDAETTSLCGTVAPTTQAQWVQGRVARYETDSATFVAFTHTNTCVLMARRAASPIARGQPGCPVIPGAPAQLDCVYEVLSLTGPAFATLATQPVFADLDGDGCPSLVAQDGGVLGLVEYAGTVSGDGCALATTATALPPILDPPMSEVIGSVPLVPPVAGLRADALVTSYGIHALSSTESTTKPIYISDRPMRSAEVGDVDADGALDVVLATYYPNFDIARRVATTDAFLLVRRPTAGPVEHIVVGDFDGDLRDDLGYVEDLGTAQRLSIAYGTVGGLGPAVAADAFSQVEFISTMQVRNSTDPFGLVDDLIVIDLLQVQGEIQPEITLLHGSPTRTMLSFYGPPVPILGTAFRAVLAGDFVDTTATVDSTDFVDLVAFQTALGGPTRVWTIPGLPNGRLGEVQYGTGPQPPETTLVDACDGAATASFCLERAKLVAWPAIVDDDPATDHDIVLAIDYRAPSLGAPPAAPHFLRFDPRQPITAADIRDDIFPAAGVIFQLEVIDVDVDGMPELVAAFGTSDPTRADGHTKICRMRRDGTIERCLDVAADIVQRPGLECVDATRGQVIPVCRGDAGDAQLVVLCRDAANSYAIPLVGSGGELVAAPTILTVPRTLGQIQLGDVTGDAVDDLVAIDVTGGVSSLQVYPQLTTRERQACEAE